MQLGFEKRGRCLIVKLSGELDHHTADSVRTKIDNRLEAMGYPNLVFDMDGMNFMDSSGIGVIIGRYRKVHESQGKVVLACLKPNVKKVFELGGIFTLMEEYGSVEDAINSI